MGPQQHVTECRSIGCHKGSRYAAHRKSVHDEEKRLAHAHAQETCTDKLNIYKMREALNAEFRATLV